MWNFSFVVVVVAVAVAVVVVVVVLVIVAVVVVVVVVATVAVVVVASVTPSYQQLHSCGDHTERNVPRLSSHWTVDLRASLQSAVTGGRQFLNAS